MQLKFWATEFVPEPYAVVSAFVRNSHTGKVYGMTNSHVTRFVQKHLTLKTAQHQGHISFGKINRAKLVQSQVDYAECVDLFEITEAYKQCVRNEILDENGEPMKVVLYDGPIESLYGKCVTKLRPSFSDYEVNSEDNTTIAIVQGKKVHQQYGSLNTFLVKGRQGSFSKEGDSGTPIVLVDKKSKDLILVGIVSGGIDNNNDFDTACLFLPTAVKSLEERYCMSLSMKLCDTRKQPPVPMGCRIYLDCVPTTIDGLNNLLDLASVMAKQVFIDCRMDGFQSIRDKEKMLKEMVYDGNSFGISQCFQTDNPVSMAIEHGLKAFHSILNGLRKDAELYLLTAFRCTTRCPDLMLWLFCKNICYLVWFLSTFEVHRSRCRSNDDIIKDVAMFYDNNRTKAGFPRELDVNLPLALSQLCQNEFICMRHCESQAQTSFSWKQRKKAIELLKCATNFAERQHEDRPSAWCLVRRLQVKCQLAYCLLGCSHEYKTVNFEGIPEKDIQKARMLLDDVEKQQSNLLAIPRVSYLIAKSDLYYRQDMHDEALKVLEKCKDLATAKRLRSSTYMTHSRMKFLKGKRRDGFPSDLPPGGIQTPVLIWLSMFLYVLNMLRTLM